MNPKEARETADKLFTKRETMESLWQEMSEHFYPERADFTYRRTIGDDFAGNLLTSYPLIARRELANQVGMMLRPGDREWFMMDTESPDRQAKLWLEWANGVQRRAMYDRVAQLARATKEADNDWSTFGQFAMSIRLNNNQDALIFKTWHLRDCVWMESEEGEIVFFARRWHPDAKELYRYFGDKCHHEVKKLADKDPFQSVDCYHFIMKSDMYDGERQSPLPWVSVYLDAKHQNTVMEETHQRTREVIVPRWQTVSGSQYAYSPAVVAALPDARLIQSMTYTLLEAGEKFTNPPLIATKNVVKSDVSIYAGGITWVDQDYDERLGAALRPISQDYRGLPYGMEMMGDVRSMIHQAFFLNKLNLPERKAEMTAYETGERIKEYIRGALPLFEPMEYEYNGQLCELTFETLLYAGAFGSPLDMPQSLRGASVEFKYRSPLHDAIEASRAQTFREGGILLAEAAALDPSVAYLTDTKTALREALEGIGYRQNWLNSEEDVQKMVQANQEQQQQQQLLNAMEQGGRAAKDLAAAGA